MVSGPWRRLEPLPPSDELTLGDVVLVNVVNKREQAEAGVTLTGKFRPSVWIARSVLEGWTGVVGLTTKASFDVGGARRPATGQFGYFARPSYLWGGRIVWVTDDSIERRLGRVDEATLDAVWAQHGAEMRALGLEP